MPRDGSATKTRLLDSAETLMLNRGFAATSVDEVIAAANSSKGAFFNHFPSKGELGRALITRYADNDIAQLRSAMAEAETITDDPAEQVIEFIRIFEERADEIVDPNQASCLYVSFLQDRELTHNGHEDVIVKAVNAWRETISAKLIAAASDRHLDTEVDMADLANHIFVTFEGAFILTRTMNDTSQMRAQLRTLRLLVSRLLEPTGEHASRTR